VAGVTADRELPVVWAVCKGSAVNKAILVPLALAISAFSPWAVTPLLMMGGAFLCFEGFEKLAHKFRPGKDADDAQHKELVNALSDPKVDLGAYERDKVKGAIRTDFVLSAEIIAITLGTVAGQPFLTQVTVLTGIAIIMTIGVYGLVAGIVKLDDGGLALSRKMGEGGFAKLQRRLGRGIVAAAPWLMKFLSIAGTAAMFLVGGGILRHGIPVLQRWIVDVSQGLAAPLSAIAPTLLDGVAGVIAGAIVLAVVSLVRKLLPARK